MQTLWPILCHYGINYTQFKNYDRYNEKHLSDGHFSYIVRVITRGHGYASWMHPVAIMLQYGKVGIVGIIRYCRVKSVRNLIGQLEVHYFTSLVTALDL